MALEHRMIPPAFAITYAMRVLETVDRHGSGVTLDQLSRELGVPREYLTPMIDMLRHEGYLTCEEGGFVLGDSAIMLGGGGRRQAIGAKLQSVLEQLRDEVDAAVYFGRYDKGELRVPAVADSEATPRVNEWVDFRSAAHATALGKCLLAQLDLDGRRDHLTRHRTPRFTSKTITSAKTLFDTLDSQPPTAPCLDLQEYALGTVCAAVPVTVGSMVGCLAVSMPLDQVHRLRAAADLLNRRCGPVMLSHAIR
ncbi:IclR family transcriptional regulator [Streptantibioticus silvisoli]|uniref:IclR family transcriptional regulator n=1 Tax=Streptantibioticus silvisoli TaxID=2705255 RepID=UPI003F6A89BE